MGQLFSQSIDLTDKDLVVIVIGQAGAGKTSFINAATGSNLPVGHNLQCCTKKVQSVTASWRGRKIVFVDTPAFDIDIDVNAEANLRMKIEKWQKKTSTQNHVVTGFVYLHRISETRITEPLYKRLTTFEGLCGGSLSEKVLLVTTMWDEVDQAVGTSRERQIRANYWETTPNSKSLMTRFYKNDGAQAWRAMDLLLTGTTDVKLRDLSRDDIIIALMGPMEVGKSTFANLATGKKILDHSSRRSTIRAVRTPHYTDGRPVVFLDTPGFDDISMSNLNVLKEITVWLKEMYSMNIKLAGIIYLHRISDTRMQGSHYDTLQMFEKLCGPKAAQNVILTTTMWNRVSEDEGSRREKELKEKYWKSLLDNGSVTARFLNTPNSAWSIADSIIQKRAIDSLSVQDEMVRLQRPFNQTGAGIALCEALQKALTLERDDVGELFELGQVRNNAELARQFKTRYDQIEDDLRKIYDQGDTTKVSLVKQILSLLTSRTA